MTGWEGGGGEGGRSGGWVSGVPLAAHPPLPRVPLVARGASGSRVDFELSSGCDCGIAEPILDRVDQLDIMFHVPFLG